MVIGSILRSMSDISLKKEGSNSNRMCHANTVNIMVDPLPGFQNRTWALLLNIFIKADFDSSFLIKKEIFRKKEQTPFL